MRRSGRSTRLIDHHIQTLFTENKVKIYDHYRPQSQSSSRTMFDRVLQRLQTEHSHLFSNKKSPLTVDRPNHQLSLKHDN